MYGIGLIKLLQEDPWTSSHEIPFQRVWIQERVLSHQHIHIQWSLLTEDCYCAFCNVVVMNRVWQIWLAAFFFHHHTDIPSHPYYRHRFMESPSCSKAPAIAKSNHQWQVYWSIVLVQGQALKAFPVEYHHFTRETSKSIWWRIDALWPWRPCI